MPRQWFSHAMLVVVTVLTAAAPLSGQLISPGKLSSAHSDLEGIRNCTQCHTLGSRGADQDLCLACHTPLAERIASDRGLHASFDDPDCASCHKEHFGVDFDVLRFDSLSFEHGPTGYDLEDAHAKADCRSCHLPEFIEDPVVRQFKQEHGALSSTFLGLGQECTSCHEADNPHEDTFESAPCTDCHTQVAWDQADGFDHDQTDYPLTGRHRDQDCSACHTDLPARGPDGTFGSDATLRFDGLTFSSCTSCHEDEHEGAMSGSCETCHSTAGWLSVDPTRVDRRFNHASTGFDLIGRHAAIDCVSCHDPDAAALLEGIAMTHDPTTLQRAFPRPQSDECTSCHVDAHDGALSDEPQWSSCLACHGQQDWLPADFDLVRHNLETSFVLEGAHQLTPCASCHANAESPATLPLVFDTENPSDCLACHSDDNVHGEQFVGRDCATCHSVDAFVGVAIDHSLTRFPLDGAHSDVECVSCHVPEPLAEGGSMVRYRPLDTSCAACHGDDV